MKLSSKEFFENDDDLKWAIINLVDQHYAKQGGEKMLKQVKFNIVQEGNELHHKQIEITWKFNKRRKP